MSATPILLATSLTICRWWYQKLKTLLRIDVLKGHVTADPSPGIGERRGDEDRCRQEVRSCMSYLPVQLRTDREPQNPVTLELCPGPRQRACDMDDIAPFSSGILPVQAHTRTILRSPPHLLRFEGGDPVSTPAQRRRRDRLRPRHDEVCRHRFRWPWLPDLRTAQIMSHAPSAEHRPGSPAW